ncbi:SDR family oxidoreductase [Rhodococcus sp. IEGM 1381]|uniref:SDR family oxidoreductase n=1 Tax=Rhodococcus sp. IEGM 1381 TaxID=3047085 RepID=UPI0024B7A39E|nr:SDR family oxidoreductase [Rhodococcus sp. IEGM 1381]MDI9894444.1 SDR family oxidoreductase [Rhodococcus sp. IEGM 1381]
MTGGGSGIGAAIAIELARLGAAVALLGRRQDKVDAIAERIVGSGGTASGHSVDVRRRDTVESTLAEVVSTFGKIDVLVNSAAGNFTADPENLSPNGWSSVVDIVLDGTWNCTQTVGRHLIGRGSPGAVLNIGSNMSRYGGPHTVHSASAKAAVLAMSKSLGVAWGPHGIRVNTLIPGPVADTAGVSILHEAGERAMHDTVPLGRSASKLEVAQAASYLLSDYASFVTGTELVIDGGRSLGRD